MAEIRYTHKNKEKILLELEKQNNQANKNKIQIIDLQHMNQYQFWKYVERLKDFERKEVEFHTTLRNNIAKLHNTIESGQKGSHVSSHDILYYNKKLNKNKSRTQNKDLSPIRNKKSTRKTSAIRIKTKSKLKTRVNSEKKIKPRLNSASNPKRRKGRNSEMGTTMSSFVNKSRKIKEKKTKLPSIKFSFDLDSDIPGVKSAVSKYTLQDINMSSEMSKNSIGTINEGTSKGNQRYQLYDKTFINLQNEQRSK